MQISTSGRHIVLSELIIFFCVEGSLGITLTVPFIKFLYLSFFSGKMEDSKLSGLKEQLKELELGVHKTQVKPS